jgi:signal peptidase II
VIIYYYPQVDPADWSLRVAMAMQTAGAAGNLLDRLMHQEVTDFISVGIFPVFNVADASITVGVAVLLLGVWIKERAERREQLTENREQLSVTSEQAQVNSDQSQVGDTVN